MDAAIADVRKGKGGQCTCWFINRPSACEGFQGSRKNALAVAVVLAVAHQPYLKEGWGLITSLLDGGKGVVADVKGVLPRDRVPEGVALWRL